MKSSLQLFNTLSGKKEPFAPSDGNTVRIYACGPTVYDLSHLGHARMAVVWDVIVRYFRFLGYNVIFVRNLTDVDDKIINRAKELGLRPEQIAREFTYQFWRDMHDLNVQSPDFEPRATDYIAQMLDFIEGLIEGGHAYASHGDVYFDVSSFPAYGKLGKKNLEDLLVGAREQARSQQELSERKRHPADFALWKGAAQDEPGWNSPWGHGRPGWHIECSTMIRDVLGESIDIHGGGMDLVFPHHENELAQSESLTHKPLARFWLHNAMVQVDRKKMGKSEGNFKTIQDLLSQFSADTIRLLLLQTHYRSPVEFSKETLESAKIAAQRLARAASITVADTDGDAVSLLVAALESEFIEAMNNDFNTSVAMSVLFKLADLVGESKQTTDKAAAVNALGKYSSLLGLTLTQTHKTIEPAVGGQVVDAMLELRKAARAKKDFATSDLIRDQLKQLGINVMDTKEGSTWERI
jgi:cysteinyl-tRNA synthetase